MALHPYEIEYLKEIKSDLEHSAAWVDEILEIDDLDHEDTLVKAALAYAYSQSVTKRIQTVIDALKEIED